MQYIEVVKKSVWFCGGEKGTSNLTSFGLLLTLKSKMTKKCHNHRP